MNILAFDTSSYILDICLMRGEESHSLAKNAGLRHSELLIPGIEYLLDSTGTEMKDIDLIVCSKGPGSFTGLRIGISTAKGLSAGSGSPLVSVPSLDAMAYPFSKLPFPVLPVIDAKKKRFYGRLFCGGAPVSDITDGTPDEFENMVKEYENVYVTGPDARLFLDRSDKTDRYIISLAKIRGYAESLAVLGREKLERDGPDEEGDGPIYVRKSEAEIEREKRERADRT